MVDELHVSVLGTPFGMKLYTDGVLVIDITTVETVSGGISPGKTPGLKGDYILSADGKQVLTNEELSAAVAASGGNRIKLVIKRGGTQKTVYVTPALSKETNSYRIGLWVRTAPPESVRLHFTAPQRESSAGSVTCMR
ncbi:MAG: hypothetical protein ACLR56_09545 [Oscillospiraceae bacterium]